MNVITTEKLPIKLWLDDLEEGALEQAKNLANLPFAFKHIAIMPDSHQGYGMPIGGVIATKDVIIPNAVGVDIGCGVCAVKTNIQNITKDELKVIMGEIRKAIPVGFAHHKTQQDELLMPLDENEDMGAGNLLICEREFNNALFQLGTLGGGNHFIEIQKGSDGFVWIMIHSGSRNLGKQVADYYNTIAEYLNEQYFSSVTKDKQLAFLPTDSVVGQNYIKEMQYCVEFALANRKLMMDRICEIISNNKPKPFGMFRTEVMFEPMINIAHNYAVLEHHFGQNVWVHRKGATKASQDTIGIIPGSQGSKSYIVQGLGNKDSFESCSHGAGRKMGREQAKRTLDLQAEIKRMNDLGVIHGIRNINDLDEAAGAYKDIDTVMTNQKDLVKILVELTPLAVIKG